MDSGEESNSKEGDMGFMDLTSFQDDRKSGDLSGFLIGGRDVIHPMTRARKLLTDPSAPSPGACEKLMVLYKYIMEGKSRLNSALGSSRSPQNV